MQYRAVIKKQGEWWVGWLLDLQGVNAQERTRGELLRSLSIGAKEMLETEVAFEKGAEMVVIEVPDPGWVSDGGHSRVAESQSDQTTVG